MRFLPVLLALGIVGLGADNVNYDSFKPGKLPVGWSSPTPQRWAVHTDKSAPSKPNILEGAGTEDESLLAVFDKTISRDADIAVKLRISPSHPDGAAGIVWRYRDAGNYYVLSVSTSSKDVVVRRIANGVAQTIPVAAGRNSRPALADAIKPGEWHVLKVSLRGSKVQVFFGNRSLFTIPDAGPVSEGKAGVWAKSPGGATFDDFRLDKKG